MTRQNPTRRRLSLTNGTSRGVVLDLIRSNGPISRVDLAEITGLTQATMSTVARQLLNEGLVVESVGAASRLGRPPVLLELEPNARLAVGIQIGLESITYAAVNLKGALVARVSDAGIGSGSPETMVARVVAQTHRLLAVVGAAPDAIAGVGVAAPGPVDLERGSIAGPPQLAAWSDVPIRDMLREALNLPVVIDNDATAAALGDFWSRGLSADRAHATIYMGSGIGAGILLDGAVYRGASSNAGEIGQLIVDRDHDGRPLTVQQVAAPDAVVADALSSPADSRRLKIDADDSYRSFMRLATAAVQGDKFAERIIRRAANYLADGAVGLANLFDVDSIALAGPAFTVAGSLYVEAVQGRLEELFFARSIHGVTVRLSTHAGDAAAVGAATLLLQSELAPRNIGLAQAV
jgi:predicted NBD/HSP70 family sugar kinase